MELLGCGLKETKALMPPVMAKVLVVAAPEVTSGKRTAQSLPVGS